MSHQAKRPYTGSQPSITSYFPATSPTSQPSYKIIPQSPDTDVRSPPLPPNVQANLLSVGMRVRKSVPEGYKTGSYSAFTLFQDPPPVEVARKMAGERRVARPRARELTPFCGLNKVGGLAQQEWGIYDGGLDTAVVKEDDDYEDDTPVLSQGSTVSNASTASGGALNKRRFVLEDGDEDEDKAVFGLGGRAIAVPRRMNKGLEKGIRVVGQENARDFDFEDAEFLDYGLVGGGDEEMGGV